MVSFKRLPRPARVLFIRGLIKHMVIASRNPSSKVFVQRLMQSVRSKRVLTSQFMPTMKAHFGRAAFSKALSRIGQPFEEYLLKTRELVDDSTGDDKSCACHGCMSYKSQVLCEACSCPRFCVGCYDYGPCITCADESHA